jgi:hypothetical protein
VLAVCAQGVDHVEEPAAVGLDERPAKRCVGGGLIGPRHRTPLFDLWLLAEDVYRNRTDDLRITRRTQAVHRNPLERPDPGRSENPDLTLTLVVNHR